MKSMREPMLVSILLLMSGCHTPPLQMIDNSVATIVSHPFDVAPAPAPKSVDGPPSPVSATPPAAAGAPRQERPLPSPPPDSGSSPFGAVPATVPKPGDTPPGRDALAPGTATPRHDGRGSASEPDDVARTSFTQVDRPPPGETAPPLRKFELAIPKEIPGAETPLVKLPDEQAGRGEAVARLFPQLPPLAEEPVPLPGPNGRPYTLADLQQLAAANAPALRQAASDVEAARGLLQQAGLYPNPTIGYEAGPNANNTATGTQGVFVDQVIKTGGKLKLQTAAAQMNLRNAELALRRARFDLATTIRTDYYNLLVTRETLRVNKALAHFTDEIFRLQADLLGGGFTASHEPAALRSQAFIVRLGYQQAIANSVFAWKQLVADMGLKQLPLSAVEGQVDRLIPHYDYDAVLAHVLRNHTDVLTARNTLQGARYNLKLAQVTPVPDVEVRGDIWKENTVFPFQNFHALTIGIPFPIWDRNQGNIRASSANLVRAAEGPHQVEVALANGLAAAYAPYKANLVAVEYYRRNVLPDQVRYYRGVFERRKIDPTAAFGDLVQAQQVLVTDVNAYLGVLGSLWTSVVNVANLIQTDDLYQLGKPLELPQLPDFDALHPLPCPHPHGAVPRSEGQPSPTPVPNASATPPPAPTMPLKLGHRSAIPPTMGATDPFSNATDPGPAAGNPKPGPPVRQPHVGGSRPTEPPYAADLARPPSAASSRSLSS
ncbi:outer membrane protein, cobalt-zinc-cadmium efflux system [Singulisphaera sp. GP187]|uniref:TolC family protein n=1 Tax=Singulisphaera sp. GP187 TaxID=1882752 RepID=UPI00092B728C|nr:TolC family protein [Singulisphaera sp. GP187]SIO59877.1 outer membrane protein, cobalt-zinc-cadmium efflux system [Singulisphaera sp. GP187]